MLAIGQRSRSDAISFIAFGIAAGVSCAAAFTIVALDLSSSQRTGKAMLAASAVVMLVQLIRRRVLGTRGVGPGVQLAALTLSLSFLVGLLAGETTLGTDISAVALLFGAAVIAFCGGAVLGVGAISGESKPRRPTIVDPLRRPFMIVVVSLVFLLAAINFLTGVIPVLSRDINASRFAGTGGVFGQFWAWIIGALEWTVVVAAVRAVIVRRLERRAVLVGAVGLVSMIMLAGRSFVVIVALASLIAVAMFNRLSLLQLVLVAVVGLALLGVAGKARVDRSSRAVTGVGAFQHQERSTVYGLVTQSVTIGPAVFATALDVVPARIPFQHGRFLLRDFRSALPLHPLGRPLAADIWVTQEVRGRDAAVTGGSPPTLVGGLYIDFGVPGVVIGSLLLGAALALLYRWSLGAGTVGALSLYCYAAAYVALASYSYVSLKPALVGAALLSLTLHSLERRRPETGPG